MSPFLISESRAGDRLDGLRPSVLATAEVDTVSSSSRLAIVRMYSRSAGVARSYREPKKPTASSPSASGAATVTSAGPIGEVGAWSQVAFPYACTKYG